ncbi:MAG: MarR family winged helix-turn-helix transcriptional regulator [Acidimicrobiales bacterium]
MTELHETAAAVRARGDAVARSAGQSQARWQVLFTLASGPFTVPDLARRLGLTRQSVQRVVDLLQDDELVAAVTNPFHRRSPRFELTMTGALTLDRINGAASDWHGAVRAALDPGERHRLRQALATLRALAADPDAAAGTGSRRPPPSGTTAVPTPAMRP